ncbi:MetQ/NlpA family ABC transporter substrate-binding protein [Salsuginibacillus kocurii]|uniref:MetQ/NlpA family ABC transporter substrate-binding protein n=1 Tax=Salsuginibacillus kocurii TaxID=427078 RepID=UPI000363C779|nr:MetQ/NlpA family ABC transporter substrate-binding protein [Salsuginibacillus kocurii]
MKKLALLATTGTAALVLAACGTDGEESGGEGEETQTLTVGASNVPHAEILEYAEDALEEEGIELEIETFNDYVLPNEYLAEGELDANYFQHIPYLEDQIEEHGYEFEHAGGIHIEPIGVYSQEYDSLDELPDGAEIIMSDSVADHGRILTLLEEEGLITLAEGVDVDATVDDIEENPRDLEFQANVEAAVLPTAYEQGEGDAVLINSNYAIDYDLNPMEDAIATESTELDNPHVNVIAVPAGDEDNEEIQTLVEVLRSEDVQDFIVEEYENAVVPVSE